jgi:hypothetical protein
MNRLDYCKVFIRMEGNKINFFGLNGLLLSMYEYTHRKILLK